MRKLKDSLSTSQLWTIKGRSRNSPNRAACEQLLARNVLAKTILI